MVTLPADDAHKIRNVLRLNEGDPLEIIDSAAQAFVAAVHHDDRRVHARLCASIYRERLAFPDVTVAQALPKGNKMDFVVEKLTELGVAAILPMQTQRTVVSGIGPQKLERWRRLAKTAAQQCGRDDVPQVAEPVDLGGVLQMFQRYDRVLLPWELADRIPLREQLPELLSRARTLLVLIGPEGGFSHDEADAARSFGAHTIWLGDRILRTETAGLVMLAIIGYIVGSG